MRIKVGINARRRACDERESILGVLFNGVLGGFYLKAQVHLCTGRVPGPAPHSRGAPASRSGGIVGSSAKMEAMLSLGSS